MASTTPGPPRPTASGIGIVDEAAGRQREPVDEIAAPGESDAAVGLGREGEEANDVRAVRWRLEDDPRVAADIVVILGQHEPLGRDDLEHRIHRRAEVPLRLEAGDEGLAAGQGDRETVHISRPGQAAIDRR